MSKAPFNVVVIKLTNFRNLKLNVLEQRFLLSTQAQVL